MSKSDTTTAGLPGLHGRLRVLFLCFTNAGRSQMAEAFLKAMNIPGLEVASAGFQPKPVHPLAAEVMAEIGMDLSSHRSKLMSEFKDPSFDVVITLCERAARECPPLPGAPAPVHWNLPEPVVAGATEAQTKERFRTTRDEVRRLVNDLVDRGYLAALAETHQTEQVVLNHVSDGVLAHDLEQHILVFNDAAERITGYRREEVLNRKCRDIFPGGLCGGKCQFQDPANPRLEPQVRDMEIGTKTGERRDVHMSVTLMQDRRGQPSGVVACFRDVTREIQLARRVGAIEQFAGIIGRDHKMLSIFDLVKDLADSNVPVLVQGESGTGKELIAAAIHNEGRRAGKLFVPVNCGALPEGLLESELFGHVRGSFTGAIRDKKGRFELADGGTIFLDEIGDISPAMQVKLLRVLQKGEFERVGSEKTIQVDVRVISATNKDLKQEIAAKRFREDLFYRLSVVPITVPPLRERRNDIPAIAEYILHDALREGKREPVTLAPETMDILLSYGWPGNVRELQNWIQFALLKCKGAVIEPRHLPPTITWATPPPADGHRLLPASKSRHKLDADAVRYALEKAKGNRVEAAKSLGVSRATLYRFLDAEEARTS